MNKRFVLALLCLSLLVAAGWVGGAGSGSTEQVGEWLSVTPDILRTARIPAGYALVDGPAALLIDAPRSDEGLKAHGVERVERVLLTHHHRDTCAAVAGFLSRGVSVRAPKAAAEWLTPAAVAKYWRESLPLHSSRTAYLVVPVGFDGIDCSLEDGQTLTWRDWTIRVIATPGHSRDHVAYTARKGNDGPLHLFCGDALCAPGKLWTPYTTDWDHWTDAGLTPARQSLRRLAGLKSEVLLPAHGPVISKDVAAALEQTAASVEEVAFLKSFERFTKNRLGTPPTYRFLAKDQVATSGEKPWSQVSDHLFLTGNTYVLTSKDGAFLVIDPWGQRSADQIATLAGERKLGPLEVVIFSHAHHDHYDGIYYLPDREWFHVWTLDRVATPIAEPLLVRAPFLDARPVRIDRRLRDGETVAWREYRFRIHHLPGQSEFTMGMESFIDGKRCFFTADNFFHQDQFSGSGGWMGLNRSYPLPYSASAQKLLDAAPDWVLAEHGGPFEFSAEDFRRRVEWGKVSAAAADALCVSGNHRHDWDPNRSHVTPLLQKARIGADIKARLLANNPTEKSEKLEVTVEGRGLFPDQSIVLEIAARGTASRELRLRLSEGTPLGLQVFCLRVLAGEVLDGTDVFLVLDVQP